MPEVPPTVADVCATFLDVVPDDLLEGLYLRGGTGFGEWVEGQSDIDFVATLTRRPTPDDVSDLRAAHEKVADAHPDVHFDGPHVLASDLAADPRTIPRVPCVLMRQFEDERAVHDGVVAWHELDRHGVTVHGPPHPSLDIWTSDDELHAFTRGNLDTYWRGIAEELAEAPSDGEPQEACCSCVTVSAVAFTAATAAGAAAGEGEAPSGGLLEQ